MVAVQQRQTLLFQNADYENMDWEFVVNDEDAHQHTEVVTCCWGGHKDFILEKSSKQRLTQGF